MVLMRLPQRFIDLFRLSILDHEGLAFRCDKGNEGPITFLVFPAADWRLWCGYGDENPGHCFGGCWRCLLALARRHRRVTIPNAAHQCPRKCDHRRTVLRLSRNSMVRPTAGRQNAVSLRACPTSA